MSTLAAYERNSSTLDALFRSRGIDPTFVPPDIYAEVQNCLSLSTGQEGRLANMQDLMRVLDSGSRRRHNGGFDPYSIESQFGAERYSFDRGLTTKRALRRSRTSYKTLVPGIIAVTPTSDSAFKEVFGRMPSATDTLAMYRLDGELSDIDAPTVSLTSSWHGRQGLIKGIRSFGGERPIIIVGHSVEDLDERVLCLPNGDRIGAQELVSLAHEYGSECIVLSCYTYGPVGLKQLSIDDVTTMCAGAVHAAKYDRTKSVEELTIAMRSAAAAKNRVYRIKVAGALTGGALVYVLSRSIGDEE